LIDRDSTELGNLRQVSGSERDARQRLPKSVAAGARPCAINSEIEPIVADVTPRNVEQLLADSNPALDGRDKRDPLAGQRWAPSNCHSRAGPMAAQTHWP
jgi:adenylyltransferase/sulfurtransferase